MPKETIAQNLEKQGVSRREFLKMSGFLAVAMGLQGCSVELDNQKNSTALPIEHEIIQAMETKPRLPVIWLEFQDCAGCSEALTRSASPTLVNLVLNTLTIEYHETLSAAAGFQVEQAKDNAMKKYAGQYILIVEGSIPMASNGNCCTIGGRTAVDLLMEAAAGAAAIMAIGNCSSFGGMPRANPNPTDAKGVLELITDKPVVNIPGCPPIPEVITGTIAHFAIFGTFPELDELQRPMTFYGKTVHDSCPRRSFYDNHKFADSFDDEGAKKGWCLHKLGCKGPSTYNACAMIKWDQGLSFPIQSGHPCLGCAEPDFWDGEGFYQ